jgi:tRNA(adenine34) deaminase
VEVERYEPRFMKEALCEAERALLEGEVPIGAVVVFMGRIVGRGHNRVIGESDPTAHAEVLALRDAGAALGNYRLSDCDLYCTIEPCAMCAGATVHARITHLFYGAADPKGGAIVSTQQLFENPGVNHRTLSRGGFLERESGDLLREFFKARR